MTEPEQQSQTPHEETPQLQAPSSLSQISTDSASSDRSPSNTASSKPEYGQLKQVEYGALASQFPAGYDPYVYGGRPESSQPIQDQRQPPSPQTPTPYGPAQTYGQSPQYGPQRQASHSPEHYRRNPYTQETQGRPGYGQRPPGAQRLFHGIDLNDPNQNPMYGHWDSYAILALVLSLFVMPLFPLIIGGISLWRTRTFHMKGFWLALAAVIINVVVIIIEIWMFTNGTSYAQLYQWMLGQMSSGGTQSGGSVSA